MIKNYLLSLYRNVIRNKFYTILNIVGLSIGFSVAIIILLYVRNEQRYDKYNKEYKRICRLESKFTVNNNQNLYATVPIPLGPTLKSEIPEIEEVVRFDAVGKILFRSEDKEYYEENFFLVDSNVFNVFTYKFLHGNPSSCLSEPNSIVLTRKIAEKYFGYTNVLDEVLSTAGGGNYRITGIVEDLPHNSHLRCEGLVSISTDADYYSTTKPSRFWRIGLYTFVLLNPNSDINDVHNRFPAFYEKYMKALGDQFNVQFELMTTPLAETHFRQGLSAELPSGNKTYILIFSAVAIFILLIASINYMNMATARSVNRAKEVGIRKVLGAYKKQLIQQFISESMALSIVALFMALLTVGLILPDFNALINKDLSLNIMDNSMIFLYIVFITIIIGLLSGSYPAFYLSSFRPIVVLKGALSRSGKRSGLLRKFLVTLQFFVAIFMIIGAIVVSGQLRYLKNKDLGFDKSNLVFLQLQDSALKAKVPSLKKELLSHSNIIAVSNSSGIPGRVHNVENMRIEQESNMVENAVVYLKTDYDFVKMLDLEIIEGRDFNLKMGTDALEAVIINESAAKNFGWEKGPLGKKIHYGFNQQGEGGRILKVIGVVKDFHFKSLHNTIEPIIFFIGESPAYYLTCRTNKANKREVIDFLEIKWNEFEKKRPFSYKYLEESMDDLYKEDEKTGFIISLTTILTIIIALLGLLGLSSFTAEQKTKEIGLRKIHGASTGNILVRLYREFALLIMIAFVIAAPIAWWRLDIWLQDGFVYFQPLHWTQFAMAGLLTLAIGIGTISYYIIKAASGKPSDAIKYE